MIMDYKDIIKGIKLIGDSINIWRSDKNKRRVLDPIEFKTEADIKAHDLINKLILSVDKKAFIVSEEDIPAIKKKPNEYWLIDPIDGTASWFEGYDGFVTQVAYIVNNIPVFGVIYAPALDKIWWAESGKGAFLNGVKLNSSNQSISKDNLKLIDNYPSPQHIAKKVSNMLGVTDYIESGSLGLKCALVADGSADIFVKDVIIRDWDIAPAFVILQEVGGFISDLKGEPIPFYGDHDKNNGLLVASTPQVGNLVVDFLNNQTN